MHISAIQKILMDKAVIVTGAPRSGTTLLGKIVGSLSGLEYHFEPPTFYMICASYVMGRIPRDVASDLLIVYAAEDLLIETIHGRGVNLRPDDDSLVLNRMSSDDLHQRWQSVSNRADALAWIREHGSRLAIKMPNIMDAVPVIHDAMPSAHLVLLTRDGRDVVRSIMQKGWVTNEGLQNDLWPYHDKHGSAPIPYWVPQEYLLAWPTHTVETRACLMWTVHAEQALVMYNSDEYYPEPQRSLVRYELLLKKPQETVSWLASRLDAQETTFTKRWLEQVRQPTSMMHGVNTAFYDRVDEDVLERFNRINSLWGYG